MDVRQQSSFLIELVRAAGTGKYGLAPFQRQYAWFAEDVEAFMRSLLKRWPIGSFTTWHLRDEQIGLYRTRGRIGPLEHGPDVPNLIVDGQNRIASIIYASHIVAAPPAPEGPYSEREVDTWFSGKILVADAETRTVTFMHPSEAWSATRMPLGDIFDAAIHHRKQQLKVFQRALDLGVSDPDLDWFMDTIPDCIRTARIVETTISDATYEEARECYLTICRTGQPISEAEFDMAFNADEAQHREGPKP